jgi:hypothetical protein
MRFFYNIGWKCYILGLFICSKILNFRKRCSFVFLIFIPGLDRIEFLQSHKNREIYQKAFDMIEKYFGTEEEDKAVAPQVDENMQQYQFNTNNAQMGGFEF